MTILKAVRMSGLEFIFVHGLSGWGSYDKAYRRLPYWGTWGGDLMTWLRDQGFACYAASVSPTGSAWDRACELYAQLAGKRTDYGKAHSRRCRHDRYGRDFTGCPLIPDWGEAIRLVLLGHSFGGATIRLFSELMAHGDPEEQRTADAQTDSLSPLFAGGMAERIHSLVTLASPMNGTTAYDLFADPAFDQDAVRVPLWSKALARMLSTRTRSQQDGRDKSDYAGFDMHLDHADELNRRIATLPHVYYFSVPCSFTEKQKDGTFRPKRGMEPLFVTRSYQTGAYTGRTAGGITVGPAWRENDGLVNTISAMAPTGAPSKPLDRGCLVPGVWNVFPIVDCDHMWPQGGLMRRHDVRAFYLDLLSMIS